MNLSTKTPSSSLKEDTEELVNSLNRMLQSAQNDAAEIAAALGRIAKNYGMSRLARETGLSRESLYRTLSGQCSPEFFNHSQNHPCPEFELCGYGQLFFKIINHAATTR